MGMPIFATPCSRPCGGRSISFPPLNMPNHWLNSHLHLQKTCLQALTNDRGGLRLNAVSCSKFECRNDVWGDSQCVEVIGIGSRVESVLEFCLSLLSTRRSIRFWSVVPDASLKWKLRERLQRNDRSQDILDVPQNLQSHFKAFVLVASAGYGDEHVIVTDILNIIKSACGLVVAIVLNPFSFEGLRRQDEVKFLLEKLQDSVNFFIEIDIDALLKTDSVTLEEALKTMNTSIFFALNAVSTLISDFHKKHVISHHGITRELTVAELVDDLEGYTKGRIGFGFGYSIESSIEQAVCNCSFFTGLQETNGIIICIFSGAVIESSDVRHLVHKFRQVTGCTQEIIISRVCDPDVEINSIATTVIALGCVEKTSIQKSSILSKLVESVPHFLGFLTSHKDDPPKICSTEISSVLCTRSSSESKVSDIVSAEGTDEIFEMQCNQLQMLLGDDSNNTYLVRDYDDDNAYEYVAGAASHLCQKQITDETKPFPVKPSYKNNFGVGDYLFQNCIDKGQTRNEDILIADTPIIYGLPVGVKTSGHVNLNISNSRMDFQPKSRDDISAQTLEKPSPYYKVSTSPKGKDADVLKKHGVLSVRAASMLEAERDSTRRLSPIMEIGYRGGIYVGHCQGGLPEGRGRLTFPDGSSYDGLWHYGKRSGLGRFCFNNGDVFQGSWRDDLMHGKGWFYFHTGDRWFANFWKGKANGRGRFYSKLGDVFYGYFQDGWKHGRFLCVRKSGTRYVEIWNEGVLESSEPLELDAVGS